jgi:hypothetical protein
MGHNHRHDPAITSLRRYWDEVVQGRPADPGTLDPALAETVHQLHARDDAPGATPDFAARLLTHLEERMTTMQGNLPPPSERLRLSMMPSPNGRTPISSLRPPLPSGRASRPWGRPMTQLATAALVVITLAAAYLAFGPPRSDGEGEQLARIPAAIVAQATPSPSAMTDETFVTITLPAGAVPGEIVRGLNHYSVPPGSDGTWDWTCCTGARLDYILEGTYTIRGAGPMQVLHNGGAGSWEEIAPGTDVVLDAGDALYSRMEDTFEAVNAGSTPVELLDAVLFGGTPLDDPIPYEASGVGAWQVHDQDIWTVPVSMPPGPVTLRLRQSTLAADAQLPLPSGAVMQLAITRDEGGIVSTQDDFTVKNLSQKPISLYALTVEPANGERGTPMEAAAP